MKKHLITFKDDSLLSSFMLNHAIQIGLTGDRETIVAGEGVTEPCSDVVVLTNLSVNNKLLARVVADTVSETDKYVIYHYTLNGFEVIKHNYYRVNNGGVCKDCGCRVFRVSHDDGNDPKCSCLKISEKHRDASTLVASLLFLGFALWAIAAIAVVKLTLF